MTWFKLENRTFKLYRSASFHICLPRVNFLDLWCRDYAIRKNICSPGRKKGVRFRPYSPREVDGFHAPAGIEFGSCQADPLRTDPIQIQALVLLK